MGTFIKGVLGGFSGKIGTVIGANWKGIDFMRSRPRKKTGASSPAQLERQAKFNLMMKFLWIFRGLLKTSFDEFSSLKTGPNAAMSINMLHAITGDYPDYAIDYAKVVLSQGCLHPVREPKAEAGPAGTVAFNWIFKAGDSYALPTDNALLVIYEPITQQVVYRLKGAARSEESDSLEVKEFTSKTVETWICFISADRKSITTSVYTGQVLVA